MLSAWLAFWIALVMPLVSLLRFSLAIRPEGSSAPLLILRHE
jgi:hypothetical protein